MLVVSCNADQVRAGVGQRGATKRLRERTPGPICPDTLANNIVQSHVRDLEAVFNEAIRALAQAGDFGKRVTAGRRVHTVRHGQGRTAWSERLATEVVGIPGLTTYAPYGTEKHGCHAKRRSRNPGEIWARRSWVNLMLESQFFAMQALRCDK